MNIALMDVGSNTIRLSVYQTQGKAFRVLFSVKERAGLANYIHHERMNEEGIGKTCQILHQFQSLLRSFPIDHVAVFATASLRNIDNTQEAVSRIFKETGIVVDVLSGREEALYDFHGVMDQCQMEQGLIFDIGGGSTELILVKKGNPEMAESIKIGSLNLYNQYVSHILPRKSEILEIKSRICSEVNGLVQNVPGGMFPKCDQICGVGGSARAARKLLNTYYHLDSDNCTFTSSQYRRLMADICKKPQTIQADILKSCPDRIHTILPGMLIMNTLVRTCGCKNIYVTNCGIREGYLVHHVIPSLE